MYGDPAFFTENDFNASVNLAPLPENIIPCQIRENTQMSVSNNQADANDSTFVPQERFLFILD